MNDEVKNVDLGTHNLVAFTLKDVVEFRELLTRAGIEDPGNFVPEEGTPVHPELVVWARSRGMTRSMELLQAIHALPQLEMVYGAMVVSGFAEATETSADHGTGDIVSDTDGGLSDVGKPEFPCGKN